MSLSPLRIGLTGGIGSGKSTVSEFLARHGATIVDTDLIARRLTQADGAAIASLKTAFGPACIDASGALDRSHMRKRVFNDAEAKRTLEAILHPLIGAEAWLEAESAEGPAVVFDIPLLVESGRWRHQVDKVLVIDCREQTQIERVISRSGWSLEAATSVIEQQATRRLRRSSADAVIYNDAIDRSQLAREVANLWGRWIA